MAAFDSGADQRSISELFTTMTSDLSTLFRQEMELAKAEIKQEASKAGQAAGMLAGAAVVALITLLILAMAASWALAEVVDQGLSFLIVGVVLAIGAVVLGQMGRKRLQSVNPKPDLTIETMREDIQTIKERRP